MEDQGLTLEEVAELVGVDVSPSTPAPTPEQASSSTGNRKRNSDLSDEEKEKKKQKRRVNNARYAALNRERKKAAAKAIQDEIESLKAENASLKAENASLKSLLWIYQTGDYLIKSITPQ